MIRNRAVSFAAALLLVGCGSDSGPTGPETVRIAVTVDWPLAREEGFVNARWQLIEYMDAQHKNVLVKEGSFSAGGIAEIRYTTTCRVGFGLTGHEIRLRGNFTADDCLMAANHDCTSEPQTFTVPPGGGIACSPPSD